MGRTTRQRHRDGDRLRLERAAELYLSDCFEARTTARADEFAERFLRQARPYVSRVAIAATGRSITALLREKQLARAKRLLESLPASVTIEQIAIACAFGTPWTFNRCFRAAFGITPGAYRREVANEPAQSKRTGTPATTADEDKK